MTIHDVVSPSNEALGHPCGAGAKQVLQRDWHRLSVFLPLIRKFWPQRDRKNMER